jgi:hypothetical protein
VTLYSYIVVHDTGFSPNPFFEYCTLACCKPEIRSHAKVGDWVVGLTPKAQGNKIVYFMQVDEIVDYKHYWKDRRFRQKRPHQGKDVRLKCGDNIYEPTPDGGFRQLSPSMHSDGPNENTANKEHDLSGVNVLISENFAYFGSKPMDLPSELKYLIAGRGHRCHFSEAEKSRFIEFVRNTVPGLHAPPRNWPKNDESWTGAACGAR